MLCRPVLLSHEHDLYTIVQIFMETNPAPLQYVSTVNKITIQWILTLLIDSLLIVKSSCGRLPTKIERTFFVLGEGDSRPGCGTTTSECKKKSDHSYTAYDS